MSLELPTACREDADLASSLPAPERPQFPPAKVGMVPGFPAELADHAGNILLVWTFVNTFASSLGMRSTPLSTSACIACMINAAMFLTVPYLPPCCPKTTTEAWSWLE